MSVTFRFSGGSDDIVTVTAETDSGGKTEEYYTYQSGPVMWRAEVHGPDGTLAVIAIMYDGMWAFAAAQVSEDDPLPAWPILTTQAQDCSYSTELEITAPGGSVLKNIWPATAGDAA